MTGHEGKKLLFMGQEFGQEHEWNEATELEWWRLEEGKDDNYLNIGLKYYVQKLLEIYRSHKCLYEIDDDWSGALSGSTPMTRTEVFIPSSASALPRRRAFCSS